MHLSRRSILLALPALRALEPQAHAQSPQFTTSDDVTALLERRTQELFDAIAPGNQAPWKRYLHDLIVYMAEDGRTMSKSDLLNELRPMPKGMSGHIAVANYRVVLYPTAAIANYVADETEVYFGQTIHSRYLTTDTWVLSDGDWRLAASGVVALREDPPALTVPERTLQGYVGTYALTPEISYVIRLTPEGGLTGQRTGRAVEPLRIELPDCLFVPGQPRLRKIFQRDGEGRITGFVERRESWDITWRRTP